MKIINPIGQDKLKQSTDPHYKDVLNFTCACSYMQVSSSYLYKLTSGRQIPHYCPTGKKIYFKRSELDAWLLKNRRASNKEIEEQAANYLIKNKRGVKC